LPTLPQIQPQASGSSTSSSPSGGSFSGGSAGNSIASSHTSYSASVNGHSGYKTPSPEQAPQALNRDGQPLNAQSQQSSPYGTQQGYGYSPEGYNSMNQMQSYADVHPSHMSAATAHVPASAAPTGLSHYSYQPQPSILQPGPQYASAPTGYPSYGYPNGLPSQSPASSSMNNALVPQPIQLPGKWKPKAHPPPFLLTSNSHVFWRTECVSVGRTELPTAPVRSYGPDRTTWDET
jgi:enhanced filamentous growth protein 1